MINLGITTCEKHLVSKKFKIEKLDFENHSLTVKRKKEEIKIVDSLNQGIETLTFQTRFLKIPSDVKDLKLSFKIEVLNEE